MPNAPLTVLPRAPLQATLPLAIDPRAAQAADSAAARRAFERYRSSQSAQTQRRHLADLACFARFLVEVEAVALPADLVDQPDQVEQFVRELGARLATSPAAWTGVTHGLVEAFVLWQLKASYAIGTVNVRLATVHVYAGLAVQADVLSVETHAQIALVKAIRPRQGRRIDQARETTRVGAKKSAPTAITLEQFDQLVELAAANPRDVLIVQLLGELGLRVSELAALTAKSFDLKRRTVAIYRSKVDLGQKLGLSEEAAVAVETRIASCTPGEDLFPQVRTINKILARLGKAVGLERLSAHDFRHAWATWAAEAGTPLDRLKRGGGWSNYQTPLNYINESEVANEGVVLRRPT